MSENVAYSRVKAFESRCENPEDETPTIKSPIKTTSESIDVAAPK